MKAMANHRTVYTTHGTCSQFIEVELDDDDVISRLDGVRCGAKNTSCPDQLCRALEQARKS